MKNMTDSGDQRIAYAKVVARAWSDEAYRDRLSEDPAKTLIEAGVEVPSDVEIKIVQNTPSVRHFVLPAPPPEGELMEEDLEKVAGGSQVITCPDL